MTRPNPTRVKIGWYGTVQVDTMALHTKCHKFVKWQKSGKKTPKRGQKVEKFPKIAKNFTIFARKLGKKAKIPNWHFFKLLAPESRKFQNAISRPLGVPQTSDTTQNVQNFILHHSSTVHLGRFF